MSVRFGPATVIGVGGVPSVPLGVRLLAEIGWPSVADVAVTTAWFSISAPLETVSSRRTRKRIAVDDDGAMEPPLVPLAPVPRRNSTRLRPVASKFAWSSSAASVLSPALEPLTICSEPGTYVVPFGIVSVNTVFTAPSCPEFRTVMSYCSVSPGKSSPPFTSVTDFTTLPLMTGLKRSVWNVSTAGRYVSPPVLKVSVALVAPAGTAVVMTVLASKPSWFV